jgi:penicillin-binding protein 1B
LLALYVSVTSRFDGHLWAIPSRVYSDVLPLAPGARLTREALAARLERSGYARIGDPPRRAGQFSARGDTVDVHLREFETPVLRQESRRVRVVFDRDRIDAVEDARGHRVRRLSVEPELLATLYGARQEERRPIRLEQVPEKFVAAVLAAEDARFFTHYGLDLRGLLRAAWVNVGEGRIVQGGSTITQQTVKNLFLDPSRTWWRKGREAVMAMLLEARYPKKRILEVYLNEVYLGQSGPVAICGVDAAARFYFGLPLDELSLGEWAMLAGLIRSPGSYNPFAHPAEATVRRDHVLDAMVRLGSITEKEASAAKGALRLASGGRGFKSAAWAVDFVRAELADLVPENELLSHGLSIYTTIDTRSQEIAERALAAGLERLERDMPSVRSQKRQRRLEGAVIVTEPASGAIRAMIGGRDYKLSQFNRATQARRQPGSCFKPFVYAAGFELAREGDPEGLTPATLLDDSPLELKSGGQLWRPQNYDQEFRGPVTAREALEESLNVPTARAALRTGLERIVETAHRCGIVSPLSALPSLALGAAEVTALEMASAYGTFADGGTHVTPWIVRAVIGPEGVVLGERKIEREQALHEDTAFLIRDLLHGVFERGTARGAASWGYYGVAAGKTGTTDDTRDSWFIGFTADVLALVWVGYDDNHKTGLTGASGALPIWVDILQDLPGGEEPLPLDAPEGVVVREIDLESGELAVAGCSQVASEYFLEGTEPQESCSLHAGRFRRWLRRFLGRGHGDI